jgi:hypothetical protein
MSRILKEYIPLVYSPDVLNEARKPDGKVVLRNVILQRADKKNQNGRIYPREILMRESDKYLSEFVSQRRALGELDHPEERTVVNLANVSHNITEMRWNGDELVGTVEILSTPPGNIVKELIRNGIRLGISSRGVGSVRESFMEAGTVEVEEDFNLICFDIVSNPSTHGAFINESVQHSLRENRDHRISLLINDFLTEVG